MKKYIAIIIVLLIINIVQGYFLIRQDVNKEDKYVLSDGENNLLLELGTLTAKPGASLETINDFLFDKYGPCWGIPKGQCRE